MKNIKIKKIGENNKVESYKSIKDAAMSIDTKMDLWKIEMLIADAIIHRKRAFKAKWKKVV